MKIAISSSGKDLDSQIDPRFGRCAHFIILETDDMRFDVFDNENINMSGGVGIQSASFVASKGVKAVLTGNCGPKAMQTLIAGGIEVFVGQTGTVREAIENYQKGNLLPSTQATVSEKFGIK
jgi:predicted Fe-Mo cluster-binding NifX family protein